MIDNLLHTLTIDRLDALMIFVIYPIIFVAIWKLFEAVIFRPYLELFEAREEATAGAESSAKEYLDKADSLADEYQAGITEARTEAFQRKLRRLGQASHEASEIVSKAENEAAQKIQKAREEIQGAQAELKEKAFADADALVEEVVSALKKPGENISKGA